MELLRFNESSRRRLVRAALALVGALTLAVGGLSAPAHAAPPTMWGFAFVDDPTVPLWTGLLPAYSATSAGTKVIGGTLGPGLFQVVFTGLGIGMIGNVHVTAVDTNGHYCESIEWGSGSGGEFVNVACFKPGGVPDDSQFTVLWSYNTLPLPPGSGAFASVRNVPGIGATLVYNSTGSSVAITGGGGGYAVTFGKVGTGHGLRTGHIQVTAQDTSAKPHWCKVAGWDDAGTDIIAQVWCFDENGKPADSEFTASYQRVLPVISSVVPPKVFGYVWSPVPLPPDSLESNYNNLAGFGANGVSAIGPFTVAKFPKLGVAATHVQVTAFGADPNYCGLNRLWTISGTQLDALAVCFDPSGSPAAEDVFMAVADDK
jgi:hypothetical protein